MLHYNQQKEVRPDLLKLKNVGHSSIGGMIYEDITYED